MLLAALQMARPAVARAEVPSTGDAASVALAEQRAAQAFEAYSRGAYPAAIALYLEGYESAPSASILYNVARIYDVKLGDRPLAITYYQRFIRDPGAHTEYLQLAIERLRVLRAAELMASSAPPATGEGRPARDDASHGVRAPYPDLGVKSTSDGPRPRRGWSSLRTTAAILGAGGLAGLGLGAGFGLAALAKARTARDLCKGDACVSQRGVDAANAARSDATIANIGIATGGALLLAGVALFFLGDRATEGSVSGAALRWQPRDAAASARLSLDVTGRW